MHAKEYTTSIKLLLRILFLPSRNRTKTSSNRYRSNVENLEKMTKNITQDLTIIT